MKPDGTLKQPKVSSSFVCEGTEPSGYFCYCDRGYSHESYCNKKTLQSVMFFDGTRYKICFYALASKIGIEQGDKKKTFDAVHDVL